MTDNETKEHLKSIYEQLQGLSSRVGSLEISVHAIFEFLNQKHLDFASRYEIYVSDQKAQQIRDTTLMQASRTRELIQQLSK
jgi:hypothetical protein